jgi:hypothetical protein
MKWGHMANLRKTQRFLSLGRSALRLLSSFVLPMYADHNPRSLSLIRKYTFAMLAEAGDVTTRKTVQSLGCVNRNLFCVYQTSTASS